MDFYGKQRISAIHTYFYVHVLAGLVSRNVCIVQRLWISTYSWARRTRYSQLGFLGPVGYHQPLLDVCGFVFNIVERDEG